MKKYTAVIPAAGRGSRMMGLTENNPKPMLPYNGKPIIGHTLDTLIKSNFDEVVIVVGYKKEKLIDYVLKFYKDKINIKFVEQTDLNGLAGAVLTGAEVAEKDTYLLVVLGDIILNSLPSDTIYSGGSFVGYNTVEDYSRWCMVADNYLGVLNQLYDKPNTKPPTNKALMGLYGFEDIELLKTSIRKVIDNNTKINGEFQLSSAIEEYHKEDIIYCEHIIDYYDMGEIEDLTKTRKNITRHFNQIEKTDYGTIIKTSDNKEKLNLESSWYNHLPMKMKLYTPHLYDYDLDKYEIEFISSTPIQELYIYDLLENDAWNKIMDRINNYITLSISSADTDLSYKDCYDVYVDKTISRVAELKYDPYFKKYFEEKFVTINNIVYKNPIVNMNIIFDKINSIILQKNLTKYSSYYHGDLFFGNMFYDISGESLKVIDPRGSFGESKTVGDVRYDLAKLNHSVNGYYDFIVNGLYTLHEDDRGFLYSFYEGNQDKVKVKFQQLVESLDINFEEIELITGLLFLTMIPLHSENKNNQKMQFIQATKILNKFI